MEVLHKSVDGHEQIRVRGRLDGNWADFLSDRLEEITRIGGSDFRLDMAEVEYLSSASIRVLLIHYQRLAARNGRLTISKASNPVRNVLRAVGLEELLSLRETRAAPVKSQDLVHKDAIFSVVTSSHGQGMLGEIHGDFTAFGNGPININQCRPVPYPKGTLGLGLGGLGTSFNDARERLGEFIAVAGTAVVMPTDGSRVADYSVAAGELVPTVISPYALKANGEFSHTVRFHSQTAGDTVALPRIAEAMTLLTGSETVAMVMIAVSAGLVGASLRVSPAGAGYSGAVFDVSSVRRLLRVTTEPVHRDGLALVVGIATLNASPGVAPMIRPLAGTAGLGGHFHAACVSYHPLPGDDTALEEAVRQLLGVTRISDVLHLLDDVRPGQGLGSSRFEHGVCWVAPLHIA